MRNRGARTNWAAGIEGKRVWEEMGSHSYNAFTQSFVK